MTAAAAAGGGGSQGVVPACNKFLRALGDAGRIDDAVTAYEAMTESDLLPTIVTFSTLISRCEGLSWFADDMPCSFSFFFKLRYSFCVFAGY